MLKNYVSKIQELEGELLRVKSTHNSKRSRNADSVDTDDDGFRSKNGLFPSLNEFSADCDSKVEDISGNIREDYYMKKIKFNALNLYFNMYSNEQTLIDDLIITN